MKYIGGLALLSLGFACASGAASAQGWAVRDDGVATSPSATALAARGPGAPAWAGGVREKLGQWVQPFDKATQALHIGFWKLKRVCDYGLHESAAPTLTPAQAEADSKLISARAHDELGAVKRSLDHLADDYRQNSRVSKHAACKYLPALPLLSAACQGFQEDSERLAVADQAAKRLVTQAQERLSLYAQYGELERQGCTRAGFTMKLWANEEKYLWPLLLGAPTVFKSMLTISAEN